ncbi:MAG TPA: aldo/keto reductase, partial [Aggregatilineales bacterium]|nr:aldo/keto reductase [Aggregatilineales bacterium]
MEKRRLGRTEHMSTVVIFGAAALWEIDQAGANRAFETALAAGINHIDVAPQYGYGEERVGMWLPPYRDQFFLGCKTLMRNRKEAWDQLQVSLKKLNTDHLDLYQLHAVATFEELDEAMQPGGAIEALQEAREQGLTKYLGITGHGLQAPAIQMQALERFDLDTVMFPINPVLYSDPDYRRDAEQLLQLCADRDVGVQVIKSVAKQPWGDHHKKYQTWYMPYDEQQKITEGVHFVLSQPGVAVIPAAGEV